MRTIDSHNNFLFFTVSLIILLLASGFVSSTPEGEYHLLLQFVMMATEFVAYLSLSLSSRWRNFILVILIVNVVTSVLREFVGWEVSPRFSLGVSMAFYAGMAYIGAKQVLFSGRIELNTIVGTVSIYLLLGIVWATIYLFALEFWPNGINGIEYRDWHDNLGVTLYFSFVTMTTLGYGDISPAIPMLRTLAYLQAIMGTFYMAVVVASLVGSYIARADSK